MSQRSKPQLTEELIVTWACEHATLTGAIPTKRSGRLLNVSGETWAAIDVALRRGARGLSGGITLSRLLASHDLDVNDVDPRPLTEQQILQWIDEHHVRTGNWPTLNTRPIPGVTEERWARINWSLRMGERGLPGGSSLKLLLRQTGRVTRREHMCLRRGDDSVLVGPSDLEIAEEVDRLAPTHASFLVIEDTAYDNAFMQACRTSDGLVIEFADNGEEAVFRANLVLDTTTAIAVLTAYLDGEQWRSMVVWMEVTDEMVEIDPHDPRLA